MEYGIIYYAFCICENKYYIGQTKKDLKIREREHMYHSKSGSKTYFHRALLKHKFEFSILETIDGENIFELLNEREKYWIDYYRSSDPMYGYNLQKGGRNSTISSNKLIKHKPETIEKIRNSVSGTKNPMYGISLYNKWVELYGIEEEDKKMIDYVEKHKKVHGGNKNGMFGRSQKDETKKLISEKASYRTGKKASRYVSIDEDKLREMINDGLTPKQMSVLINKSVFVIRNRIKELNFS